MKNVYGDEIGPKQIALGFLGFVIIGLGLAVVATPVFLVWRWIF